MKTVRGTWMATIAWIALLAITLAPSAGAAFIPPPATTSINVDVAIYAATPSGISAGLAAARHGATVLILERTAHIGGLMANGLGATDIKNRGAIGGIFLEFVHDVRRYYADTYGEDSAQVKACNDGYYFEPHVAELIFQRMIAAEPNITVITNAQLKSVSKHHSQLRSITLLDRTGGPDIHVTAKTFIDASYEGDLAAMAGVPYRVGREPRKEYGEPYAGTVYWNYWTKKYYENLSTGKGDNRIQAYNYRLCLTSDPSIRVPIPKPENYNRQEYMILSRQVWLGQVKSFKDEVSIIPMPNNKTDTNNHTIPLISTDLPEENYPYPDASWAWRDKFAQRLRDYTLGLLYFCQHDLSLPDWFREEASRWGLAKDEYQDNGNFPRQIYVREARRIWGEYDFTAHDIVTDPGQHRTTLQSTSIGCGSYEMDSHPTRKYQPGIPVLEGLLGIWQYRDVYQVPYGVIVPQKVDSLLVTGAISGTHLGFSTLRMEPCWMAMGQAAGTAAALALQHNVQPRKVNMRDLQTALLADNVVIMYFDDVTWDTPDREAIQFFGTQGKIFNSYNARPDAPLDRATAALWLDVARRMDLWHKARKGPEAPFPDVPNTHPSYWSIGSLAERGVFTREELEQEFRPYEELTPEDMQRWFQDAGIKVDLSAYSSESYIKRGQFLGILYKLVPHTKNTEPDRPESLKH